MIGLRRALVVIAALGVALSLVAGEAIGTSDFATDKGTTIAVGLAIAWTWIGTGLYAWARRPANRTGALMCAVGFTWLLAGLAASDVPVVHTVGMVVNTSLIAVVLHLLTAFPTGELRDRAQRRMVAGLYVLCVFAPLPLFLVGAPQDLECPRCPENVLLVGRDPELFRVFEVAISLVGVLALGWAAADLVSRVREATHAQRRVVGPILLAGTVVLVCLALQLGFTAAEVGDGALAAVLSIITAVGFLGIPFAFLSVLLRSRLARSTAVADLLTRLPDDGLALRAALADALRDRTLTLAYAVGDEPRWVDEAGHPVALPGDEDPHRRATLVERDGRAVGAIVHDAVLCDEPETLRAVAAGTALALENERLAAELRSRVADLERSRARVVEVAIAERRRLERDLHDGAQQRLVALSLTLRLARAKVAKGAEGAAEAGDLLVGAQAELDQALAELRELARGIHPAVLSDRGLPAALEALAGRSPVPVELQATPAERLPEPVEAAAYFVVAEALTNVARSSGASRVTVSVLRDGAHAVVEVADDGVGGADPSRGTGLRGLSDRLAALDGLLHIDSRAGSGTRLRAEIPCASS